MNNIGKCLGKFGFGLLLAALCWPALSAENRVPNNSATENLAAPLPVNPLLKTGKLANGLTYYIQQNARPAKHVELRLVVKAGSILEDEDQQGLAHFTEHMAFDGTRHFKKHALISYLQSLGVKFGADLNAYTSFNETVYILPIPTDKPGNLDTGFQVLEDWAQGVSMEGDAIDRERNVILEEARLGKGAGDRMMRKLLPAMYNGSRYAKRLPIGKESLLKTFPHSAIRRFYADWYRPDLEAVFVIGDIDPAKAEKLVRHYFGGLKNPPHERPRSYPPIPSRRKSSAVVVTDREATMNMVRVRYPITQYPPQKILSDYREDLVRQLFVDMLNQRLQELTQQEHPPFVMAESGLEPIAPGYRSFGVSAVTGRAGTIAALQALVRENQRARKFGFSPDELEQAKKRIYRGYETAYRERDKTNSASYASEYIRNFLVQEPIPGIANEYDYVKQMLPGITLAEIDTSVRKAIPPHAGMLVVYIGSSRDKAAIPTRRQLLRAASNAEHAKLQPRHERQLASSLMPQLPTPGRIVSEHQNKQLGTTELTLSNGVKVVLKPTDFKNDQVMLAASRFGGTSLVGRKDMYSARYASSLVYAMGLGAFTPVDLSRLLAGKSAYLLASSDAFTDNISGVASSGDLPTMFQQLYLRMQPPRRDPALFRAFISNAQDVAKDASSDPDTVFNDKLQTTLYQNHPRLLHVPKPSDFDRISLDRVLQIYRSRFDSARGFTFVIVGSFDVAKIKPLITTYLASLPTPELPLHYRDLGLRPVKGVVRKAWHIGMEPRSRVVLVFTGNAGWSHEKNVRFHLLMDAMNIRIMDTLRQKLSLIYSGGMRGALARTPYGHYRVNTILPCAPENVHKVIAAMLGEVRKMQQEGPTQEELEKVKQAWLEDYRIAMRTNGAWMDDLSRAAVYGSDPAAMLNDPAIVKSLTAADIQAAAKRYLNTGNYLQAVLYPAKDAPKK